MNMGYSRKEIEDSLSQNKYDDITATYLLLGRRSMEVRVEPQFYAPSLQKSTKSNFSEGWAVLGRCAAPRRFPTKLWVGCKS